MTHEKAFNTAKELIDYFKNNNKFSIFLFDFDITLYHLMPTLDNIADSVNYRLKLFPWK
jgi:hypothetical protein